MSQPYLKQPFLLIKHSLTQGFVISIWREKRGNMEAGGELPTMSALIEYIC